MSITTADQLLQRLREWASSRSSPIRATASTALAPAWEEAFFADRPYLLDVHCDPDVPPIPPHADLAQLKNIGRSDDQGRPVALGVMTEGLKTKTQGLLRHRG